MLFRKFRLQKDNKEKDDSASLPPSSSVPPSQSWTHQVFPSFRGEDVRRDFLSHIQKEFQRKGITPFNDNEIKRGESISPELVLAIRGSRIALILLSRNYASSSWCLDELAEIIKCREEFGQTVMVVFYKVDPSDIKKLTGDFGSVFRKTCAGKTNEGTRRWIQALAKVATLAGYVSNNWFVLMIFHLLFLEFPKGYEAVMIEKIATDISNKLNKSTPSRDFDELVGMGAHMERIELLLCLDSDEVRMIGIWGPSGIGKTTIARFLFNQFSDSFELSAFMENIKELMYRKPVCSDDYSAKLHLQNQFMSQIINHMDVEVPHLGVVENRLNDKKVLIVLDNVDQSMQLDAIAKETRWFGHGSRIIITTQDQQLLKAHGINHIYKVDYPSTHEACQIFCMSAVGKKFPKDEFQELALEVTNLLEKSLISIEEGWIKMHNLLELLGREIVRHEHESIREPGKRQFLVDARDICEVLTDDTYLVELNMRHNKLVKLWEGNLSLGNLKWMNLFHSKNLKELPDFSTATNLQTLILCGCSSLVELPYSIGSANNLQKLHLCRCTSLVELPASIGNLHKLQNVTLKGCSKLEVVPTNINLILDVKKYKNRENRGLCSKAEI
ncbi:hypothetical protein AXX17_AT3G27450 [Arabidopsis thaliana]|uniref:TIR domain-containing protein n=1 Tax=Arabidopsis thaliana TaxID=3702 RepID=A0A178VNY0_ARATH|nr:hypothetical protein AXX17_AT3G27450 [Arabidopsis thaliana]